MLRAAAEAGLAPREVSFKGALQTMTAFQDALRWTEKEERQRLWAALLAAIGGHRPGRVEPRAIKRRPKSHKLLTVPGAKRASDCWERPKEKSECHSLGRSLLQPHRPVGVKAGRGQTYVRRGKVLVFSGCKSHPATGSLQPVAIGAAVEVTKPSEPSRQMCRFGDAASRQAVTRVNVEQASKRPMWAPTSATRMGKAAAAGEQCKRLE